jgi:anthranilate phosphoribosyltransferase
VDCIAFHEGEADRILGIDPREAGIETAFRAVPLPHTKATGAEENDDEPETVDTTAIAQVAAAAGLAALAGQAGPTRDSLIYTAAIFLHHLQRFDSVAAAATAAREALKSGAAREHFQIGW